jgi:putative SOS response-associated peptidase YedK
MCGRFKATFEFSDIRVRWNLDRDLPEYTPRYNVAPETSPNIPVIIRHRGANECRLMHWGLISSWAKDPSIGNQMINARAEPLMEKPAFKDLVRSRRCIIPADGFYEWRKEGKRKVPMWVHLKTKEPFALAGLWDVWRKPGWEAGGVVYDHYHGAKRTGATRSQPYARDPTTGRRRAMA